MRDLERFPIYNTFLLDYFFYQYENKGYPMRRQEEKLSYKKSGVDIEEAERFIKSARKYIEKTKIPGVMGEIGGFSSFFALNLKDYNEPVLLSATDGVGTKLKVAFAAGKFSTIGIDLVAMCANDIVVHGGRPLFFLDYFATGKLDSKQALEVIKGISKGCQEAGCALVGGETAEMPSFYKPGEFDLAGFCVGIANKSEIVTGEKIEEGNLIIGLPSSGFHSNGYSLIRKLLFQKLKLGADSPFPGMKTPIWKVLLRPTKIYVKLVLDLISRFRINGMAHITGGGFYENIGRILPHGLKAVIRASSWRVPPIFGTIKKLGNVEDEEMFRTFNMGIGFIIIAGEKEAGEITSHLKSIGEKVQVIGEIIRDEHNNGNVEVILK